MGIICSIILGCIAGFVASKLQTGEGKGLIVNLVLGIIGGAVGGWLFDLLGITAGGILGQLVVAVIGAVIVLWAFAKLK